MATKIDYQWCPTCKQHHYMEVEDSYLYGTTSESVNLNYNIALAQSLYIAMFRDEYNEFICEMVIPGCKKENIKIEVVQDYLHITGKKTHMSQRPGASCLFHEYITLPTKMDIKTINATYESGILTIKAKKIPDPIPINIPVN